MTLPFTRDYTAIDGVSQYPAATDQRIQDGIVGVYTATKSIIGAILDAVGNVVFTRTADSPLLLLRDSAGNNRGLFDHNGYPMSRASLWREIWQNVINNINADANPITTAPSWNFWASTNVGTLWAVEPSTTFLFPTLALACSNVANSRPMLQSAQPILLASNTFASVVLEYEHDGQTGLPGFTYSGLSGNKDYTTNPEFVRFRAQSGTANWQAEARGASATTTVDTGVALSSTAAMVRFRIELHSSGSPYGAKARFFINGTLVAEITTNLPALSSTKLSIVFQTGNNGTTTANTLNIGPMVLAHNRTLAMDAL